MKRIKKISYLLIAFLLLFLATNTMFLPKVYANDSKEELATIFVDLAKKLKPTVVNISTTKVIKRSPFSKNWRSPFSEKDPFWEFFNKFFENAPKEYKQRGLGSGFIWDKDGYVVTNNHVVEGATSITVKLSNGKKYPAKIVGRDENTDIALLKIKIKNDIPAVTLGDSDKLQVGEWVMAIGNPFGLEQTVTVGIVSAKGRVIGSGPYDNYIQTDASINPGNSGGPLFDIHGRVVGINTAIVAGGTGIGFAIPVNLAKKVIYQLKTKGKVTRGWLGVMIQDFNEDLKQSFNYKRDYGVLVADVLAGEPAKKAGIKRGDVILEINGQKVKNSRDLLDKVADLKVGKKAEVKVWRNGKEKVFTVKVGERPGEKRIALKEKPEKKLGLTIRNITPEIAKTLGLTVKKGVLVVEVEPGSAAYDAGLMSRDVILEVNRKKVKDVDEFLDIINSLKEGDKALLLVLRNKDTFFTTLTISSS